MTFLIKGALLVGLLALSFVIVHKIFPKIFVAIGRMLGFRMQLTPLTEKRVRRFKSIKRGYFCFALITSVFFLSFFLELFVNNKALFVRFEDHRAVRAELDWAEEKDPDARARRAAYGSALEEAARAVEGVQSAVEESDEDVIAIRARLDEGADAKVVSERIVEILGTVERPGPPSEVKISTEGFVLWAHCGWAEQTEGDARARRAAHWLAFERVAKQVEGLSAVAEESNTEVVGIRANLAEGADPEATRLGLLEALAAVEQPSGADPVQVLILQPVVQARLGAPAGGEARAAYLAALLAEANGTEGVAYSGGTQAGGQLEIRSHLAEGADLKAVSGRLEAALAVVVRPTQGPARAKIATEHPVVTTQFPAVADWLNFVTTPLKAVLGENAPHWNDSAPLRAYGMSGAIEMEYRRYENWVTNPSSLDAEAERLIQVKITEDEARFRKILTETAVSRGLTYDPDTPLPDHKVAQYDAVRAEAQALRELKAEIDQGRASLVMPIIPHSAHEQLLSLEGSPPFAPFGAGYPLLGTDFAGRDVGAQLLYGLRVSLAFGFTVAVLGYLLGIAVGGLMGYFGGWFDILTQRFIEIWSGIPFLYTIMIISVNDNLSFFKLTGLLIALTGWVGITYTMRGEFYRERARDYTQAASAIGVSNMKIMGKHILPNALVPVVTFLPFAIVAHISTLVSLDFLGYGLPPEIPSWGRLLHEGSQNVRDYPHLVYFPVLAFASTLFCVVLIGEAVREAFDPKKYARLR